MFKKYKIKGIKFVKKVAIIGGGASALMCASHINNSEVVIFESAEKVGKKILATGNGRCNLTNINVSSEAYNNNIDCYLLSSSAGDAISFFSDIGLEFFVDSDDRVYPFCNSATGVLGVLKNKVEKKKNIKIKTNSGVKDIFKAQNGYILQFFDETEEFFDKVVVASGNTTNLKMFDKFNIKYKEFVPSLCALKTEKHKNLSGVRISNVVVRCEEKGYTFEEMGEILFKDEGISGIVIFNLSACFARKNNFNHKITLDLIPNIKQDELYDLLVERKEMLGEVKCEEFLTGFFTRPINLELLKRANIDLNKTTEEINNLHLNKLANEMKNFELSTCGYYNNNQVASGGILLDMLDENLESFENKGLYFIGEVVDVDGVCGGFNLQWAWTSGQIVGAQLWNY